MSESAVAGSETLPEILAAPVPVPALRRRVLVTGAMGMLAMDLAPILAAGGLEVFGRPRSDLDVTDERDIARAFHDVKPDVVVNCAALTRVDACEGDPRAIEVNAGGVERLARHCIRSGAQLVQVSTDFVFDGAKRSPYTEEDAPAPLSAYGRSKRFGEEAALRVPNGLVVRASWLFGTGGWNFVEAILKQAGEGKLRLSVVADQRGRPTATTDLSEAILALLQGGALGTYHFANRGEASWYEFARDILRMAGRGDVAVDPTDAATLGRPARRPAYSVLDTSKYERVTGRPIRHYTEALAEYLSRRGRIQA
jgi:dTDP-4-dehydrorhamnose reductase